MIVNKSATEMKIHPTIKYNFILIFLFVIASKSVAGETKIKCGGDYSGYQYTISSPNYPERYPKKQECNYILHGSRYAKCNQIFHLQFLDFKLPPSENCEQDYLMIGDRSLYCGDVVGIRRYPSKNNSLVLRFHSDDGRGGKGFKILVTTLPCALIDHNINNANSTESTTTTSSDEVIFQTTINGKIGSSEGAETVRYLESERSYPAYRPDIDFMVEENKSFGRNVELPLKIENADQSSSPIVRQYLTNNFELPLHESKLFRNDPAVKQVEIVTATAVKSDTPEPPQISKYFFLPPSSETNSARSIELPFGNVTKFPPKKEVDNFVTQPPTKIHLPNQRATTFHDTTVTNNTRKLPLIKNTEKVNQKFTIPARSYGLPEVAYYPPISNSETQIKTGEVFENPNGSVDCQGKSNLELDLEGTSNFRGKNPTLIENIGSSIFPSFGHNVPATTYGAPGPDYRQPPGNYPTGNADRPNDWIPTANFVPSNNYLPTQGIGPGTIYPSPVNPGIGSRYSECCNTVYSAQRFLLASPSFPSLLYSGNLYECVYSIKPYSANTCQMRFNFKFFNHGTENRFCTNGYVEINGRRICGCKKGLSIVAPVTTRFPLIIGVRYTGYPQAKFNGFLIEVIQEPCLNNYPYLSRRKKEIENSTSDTIKFVDFDRLFEITNSSLQRSKRNLGYSYPKSNFGLIEDMGVSQSWNSGNSIKSDIHQVLSQGGTSANIFAPISTCRALSFFDWTIAAKEVYIRGGRCVRGSNGNSSPGLIPGYPGYPGSGGSGPIFPGYPGNGGSIDPGYPGNGGSINPGYPGNGGSIDPGYPGNGGFINPGYPGNGGSINPGYPGNGGSISPGYPGNGGYISPAYPGNGGSISPGYPGNGGSISPGYPGNGGSISPGYPGNGGSISPGYPGTGGSISPGYPGNGGPIIPGYPGNGGSIVPGYPGNEGSISPGYPGNGGSIIPGYPGNGGSISPGYPGNIGSGSITPGYPVSGNSWNSPSGKCEDVNVIEGVISSPQYPINYPNNVNKCYRFHKAPDSCQLELAILDFDLENSLGCTKDYVAFTGQNRRYCGRSLAECKALFDISRMNVFEMYFVTDGSGSGRGFSVGFSQIRCRGLVNRVQEVNRSDN